MSKNNAFWRSARGRTGRATRCVAAIVLFLPLRSIIAQTPPEPTVNAAAGSRVFGEKGCVKCHAINGIGGTEGPDLGRAPRLRSFYDLASDMWNHGPEMVERMRELGIEQPRLSPRETGNLIAFLFTVDYFDPPGDPAVGEIVFTEKRCVFCHQVGGVGGVIGPDLSRLVQTPSPIEVATAMWNHGPAMSERLREQGIDRPSFTGSQLIDLIAYLKSSSPRPLDESRYVLPGRAGAGRTLFEEKQCVRCHGSPERTDQVGPDLAERAAHRSLTEFAAAMWNKQPAMLRAMRVRGIPEIQLDAAEMADLVAYLYSLRYFADSGTRHRGRQLLAQKGCLDCHSLNGRGGSSAVDLSGADGLATPTAVIAALWNHTLIAEVAEGAFWPAFRPGEMADLTVFLQTERPPR